MIVGTHFDLVKDTFPPSYSEDLQQLIRDRYCSVRNFSSLLIILFYATNCRFINVVDAEKCGLPRVVDTIEISCRTRHNIRLLCNLIYDTVFSLKLPGISVDQLLITRVELNLFSAGSKERMLEQRIPATYLALEDVVACLAAEQKNNGRDPLLTSEQYRLGVTNIMSSKFRMSFRDMAELNQVTYSQCFT